jgi:DNA helicase-2/ATP-dependent DNA helicase PcrA
VLDYDDLLLYWAQMVGEPELGREIGERFSHVLVDEYQDTNRLQAAILLAMKPDGRGLTVVGDDAQSIYAFRGARVRNILDFPGHFDRRRRRVVTLRAQLPLDAADPDRSEPGDRAAAERFTKDLWSDRASSEKPRLVTVRDDAGQAIYVVEQTLARREAGIPLKAQAVLFRTAQHSMRLELELTRRNIPFVKYGGLKFLEAAHVKDRAGDPALGAESARPHGRFPRHATGRRHRPENRRPGADQRVGTATPGRAARRGSRCRKRQESPGSSLPG